MLTINGRLNFNTKFGSNVVPSTAVVSSILRLYNSVFAKSPAPVFILSLSLPSTNFNSRLSQVVGSSVYTSNPSLESVRNSKLRLESVPPSHFLNCA